MKLPFSFSLKFVFRLLFPGFILSLALFPLFESIGKSFNSNILPSHIIVISSILFGWFFIVLDMNLYMLLEGRRYWPHWLSRLFLKFENKRLLHLQKKYEIAKKEDHTKYIELSVELRRFPLNDDGEPVVIYPTRLGNLLASYEEYPKRAYGMDSIFYWYRIWVVIDEDLREHIDSQQALTDSTVYMSSSLFIAGIVSFIFAVVQTFPTIFEIQLLEINTLLAIGTISLILSYFIYRSSLHLHAGFGELYKSMFDMHKDKIPIDETLETIASLTKDKLINNYTSAEKYMAVWRYLQNNRIKKGNTIYSVSKFKNKK